MNYSYLFLDECMSEHLDLAALTGILIPLDKYIVVRDRIRDLIWEILSPPDLSIPAPIELHSRELFIDLPGRSKEELDELRKSAFSKCVNIVNDLELHVVRVAYLNRSEIASVLLHDSKLYGLNFFGVMTYLQDKLIDTIIQPVMDGIPETSVVPRKAPAVDAELINAFAKSVHHTHFQMGNAAVAASVSIMGYSNIAEPVFADSCSSFHLQLADMISYLLHQMERSELLPDYNPGEFKSGLLEIARSLNSDLLHTWKGRLGPMPMKSETA